MRWKYVYLKFIQPITYLGTDLRENEARGAVQVVEPGKLTVSIEQKGHSPIFSDEYYLVVGREYIMKVYLYDRHEHLIFYNGVCKALTHYNRRY